MGFFEKIRLALERSEDVLGMNRRNLEHVYPLNERRHYMLADDKLLTKKILSSAGVPVPSVIAVFESFYELRRLGEGLADVNDFVMKPSKGSGGGGILVISSREREQWHASGGTPYSIDDLKKHASDIIFGVYSFDLNDKCVIEERIIQAPVLKEISPFGLPDLRVVVRNDSPVMAMLRVPTKASGGRSNLHQGAIGIGVDTDSGRTTGAILKGESIERHTDTGAELVGIELPYWQESLEVACSASRAVPLNYLGVDIALSERGPLVLEINARPGLEIQNANHTGLRGLYRRKGGGA